jgi:hypothetical protein
MVILMWFSATRGRLQGIVHCHEEILHFHYRNQYALAAMEKEIRILWSFSQNSTLLNFQRKVTRTFIPQISLVLSLPVPDYGKPLGKASLWPFHPVYVQYKITVIDVQPFKS